MANTYHITGVKYREAEGTRYIQSVTLGSSPNIYPKQQIIDWIENQGHLFYPFKNGQRGERVRVIEGKTMKYLRSEPDDIEEDNLGELPEIA